MLSYFTEFHIMFADKEDIDLVFCHCPLTQGAELKLP